MSAARPLTRRLVRPTTYGLAPLARAGLRPDERFVIYCPPRTGSALLSSLLDSHPAIRCEGELLSRRVPSPLTWFDGRSARARLRGNEVWGCKIISQHLTWFADEYGEGNELLVRLVDRGYHLVVLRRRQWLLQALSLVHSSRTQYHFTSSDSSRFSAMTVDPVQLLSLLHTVEQEDERAAASVEELPHVSLWYEDDLVTPDRQQATVDRLTDLFGVPRAPVTTNFVTVAPRTLAGRVANLEEVAELIARTRFARYLDAGSLSGAPPAVTA